MNDFNIRIKGSQHISFENCYEEKNSRPLLTCFQSNLLINKIELFDSIGDF